MTPEGKVKKVVSDLLKKTPNLYYTMPVPGFGGDTTLDYLGSHLGRFFAVETKAPGNKMTERQEHIAARIRESGAKVFVIDGKDSAGMKELREWLGADE